MVANQQFVPPTGQRSAPSGEECLLAATAYLSLFVGFILIGPLIIYFWKREQSRFVAWHSAQAIIATAMLIILSGLAFSMTLSGVLVIGMAAARASQAVAMLAIIAVYVLGFLLVLLPLISLLVAGWRALHGKAWSIPVIGALAERIVSLDGRVGGKG
jgi:uncharacterized Tic20 family protein